MRKQASFQKFLLVILICSLVSHTTSFATELEKTTPESVENLTSPEESNTEQDSDENGENKENGTNESTNTDDAALDEILDEDYLTDEEKLILEQLEQENLAQEQLDNANQATPKTDTKKVHSVIGNHWVNPNQDNYTHTLKLPLTKETTKLEIFYTSQLNETPVHIGKSGLGLTLTDVKGHKHEIEPTGTIKDECDCGITITTRNGSPITSLSKISNGTTTADSKLQYTVMYIETPQAVQGDYNLTLNLYKQISELVIAEAEVPVNWHTVENEYKTAPIGEPLIYGFWNSLFDESLLPTILQEDEGANVSYDTKSTEPTPAQIQKRIQQRALLIAVGGMILLFAIIFIFARKSRVKYQKAKEKKFEYDKNRLEKKMEKEQNSIDAYMHQYDDEYLDDYAYDEEDYQDDDYQYSQEYERYDNANNQGYYDNEDNYYNNNNAYDEYYDEGNEYDTYNESVDDAYYQSDNNYQEDYYSNEEYYDENDYPMASEYNDEYADYDEYNEEYEVTDYVQKKPHNNKKRKQKGAYTQTKDNGFTNDDADSDLEILNNGEYFDTPASNNALQQTEEEPSKIIRVEDIIATNPNKPKKKVVKQQKARPVSQPKPIINKEIVMDDDNETNITDKSMQVEDNTINKTPEAPAKPPVLKPIVDVTTAEESFI